MTAMREIPTIDPAASPLDQLVLLSRFYGADPAYVIAGGGNTSVKDEKTLLVKASGSALASIDGEGFVALDRAALGTLLAQELDPDPERREARYKQATLDARLNPERGQRPSVECAIHHLLPARFVIHTHATRINAITCGNRGEEIARDLLGDRMLWVPYVDPGFVLAKEIARLLDQYRQNTGNECPPYVLMKNHGLIVCADTADEVLELTEALMRAAEERLGPEDFAEAFGPEKALDPPGRERALLLSAPALRALLGSERALKIVTLDDSPAARAIACGANGKTTAQGGPLTPDQIVYCGSFPLWFSPDQGWENEEALVEELREAIAAYINRHNVPPAVVIVEGLGVLAAGDTASEAQTIAAVYRDAICIMAAARRLGGVSYLTDRQRAFIESWEVEKFRRKVSTTAPAAGKAAGKVALVTGAAQGFGLEIAQSLAAEGAHVVLADLQERRVRDEAKSIEQNHGPDTATAIAMNVAESASVKAALLETVRRYGGIDLLVSNAGVLIAGSVKEIPPEKFEIVTRVNYTGYFLCVQNAAPIMATQHRARPEVWADIVQINSKSGLEGSNKNGAYAGGKFGGIGLTQSFAKELVADGIKVNAICPGNFFDGPLWSDPETGLFVQYLRTNKVPGAKTVRDVRAAYEQKVPMGRGCCTADVMKALFYILEQQYETGQALPVTGGQIMLH